MRLSAFRLGVLVVSFGVAGGVVASAQSVPATPVPRGPQADQLRTQISMMEGMLERAVGEGIRETMAQIPDALSVPWMLSPNSRVHGFKIDGYGVFFSVEVPGLSPSITWSLQVMNRNNDAAILKDLDEMRSLVVKMADQKARAEMQQRIDQVEARISGLPPDSASAAPGTVRRVRTLVPQRQVKQPDEIYTDAVRSALVKAILDQGTGFEIGPEECLTVAARGSEGPRPLFPDQEVATMYLTIKGKDLAAVRRGQLSREQAAKNISVTHF